MQLQCKNCGVRIPARHINVQTMTAVCVSCDAVFTFQPVELATGIKTKPNKVKQPSGFTLTETDAGVTLDIRWLRVLGWVEAVGMVVFLLGAVGFFLAGITTYYVKINPLLSAALLALSLVFWYLLVMIPLNRTTFEVDADQLRIRHRPLWYPGLTLDRGDIQMLTLKPLEGLSGYQELRAALVDGREKRIDVLQTAHAVYVKRMLEKHLELQTVRQQIDLEPRAVERLRIGDDGELIMLEPHEEQAGGGAEWDRRTAGSGEQHV